jgi:hypothetical protein
MLALPGGVHVDLKMTRETTGYRGGFSCLIVMTSCQSPHLGKVPIDCRYTTVSETFCNPKTPGVIADSLHLKMTTSHTSPHLV